MFSLSHMDGDEFDDAYPYIVVYDRENKEVLAFYRYALCRDMINDRHNIRLSTFHYYRFSHEFIENVLPYSIELGRSVVNASAKRYKEGLQAVWTGLGVLVYEYTLHAKGPKIQYLFGKFSLQWKIYDEAARAMILYLFKKYFPPMCGNDEKIYITPREKFITSLDFSLAMSIMDGRDYKSDRTKLLKYLTDRKLPRPQLAESYANIGGLRSFETVMNTHLESDETGILQNIEQIDASYIKRFVDGYVSTNSALFV